MIKFENITVCDGEKALLSNIFFDLKESQKVLLRGRSGSGKTTFLKTILGGYIPNEGSIFFNGDQITEQNVSILRKTIAYIFQEPILFGDTVLDFFQLPFSFHVNSHLQLDREHVVFYLKKLYLQEAILSQKISVLSGGEKQRLAIVAALLLNKKVFVLDEVTSALDAESKQVVRNLFSDDKYTVIATTHDDHFFKTPARCLEMVNGFLMEER